MFTVKYTTYQPAGYLKLRLALCQQTRPQPCQTMVLVVEPVEVHKEDELLLKKSWKDADQLFVVIVMI